MVPNSVWRSANANRSCKRAPGLVSTFRRSTFSGGALSDVSLQEEVEQYTRRAVQYITNTLSESGCKAGEPPFARSNIKHQQLHPHMRQS
jgi:hypothetical protein